MINLLDLNGLDKDRKHQRANFYSGPKCRQVCKTINIWIFYRQILIKGCKWLARPICIEQINVIIGAIQSAIPRTLDRGGTDWPARGEVWRHLPGY